MKKLLIFISLLYSLFSKGSLPPYNPAAQISLSKKEIFTILTPWHTTEKHLLLKNRRKGGTILNKKQLLHTRLLFHFLTELSDTIHQSSSFHFSLTDLESFVSKSQIIVQRAQNIEASYLSDVLEPLLKHLALPFLPFFEKAP